MPVVASLGRGIDPYRRGQLAGPMVVSLDGGYVHSRRATLTPRRLVRGDRRQVHAS